jgi:hypothetical protein
LELTSDGDDSGSKNAKETVGDLAVSAFGRSLESGGQFCVRAFGSRHEDVFAFNLLYKETLLVTFSAICK